MIEKHIHAALMLALLASPATAAVELASHRAVYDVGLLKLSSASPVVSVAGRSAYSIQRHCDGWQTVEDFAVSFGLENGQSDFVSRYETWESASGNAFSFTVHEDSSDEGESRHNGFAQLGGGASVAHFVNGADSTMPLPEGTVFPVTHMRQLLGLAGGGGRFLQSVLFLGGDREDSLYRVSGVFGQRRLESLPALGQLGEDGYWPLRLAYFDPESLESSPEYEIGMEVQENGVIRSYLVDYGDFSMSGSLMKIEPLEEPEC